MFSNKDLSLIARSSHFDESWYKKTYPDVEQIKMAATEHYFRYGVLLSRNPSKSFSTKDYLEMYPDVKSAKMNPLVHYELYGAREGRLTKKPDTRDESQKIFDTTCRTPKPVRFKSTPEAEASIKSILSAKLNGGPKRLFPKFDVELEDLFVGATAHLYDDRSKQHAATKVSVVMPTYNRGDRIESAIKSLQAQKHGNFELLIVDDGSTDNTCQVLEKFEMDPRIRTFWNDHRGVSAARNTALKNATGNLIFYLDTDNVWTPDFLATMVVAFNYTDSPCIYGASKLQNAYNHVLGYRGEPYNWEQCLNGNYVDMNVLGHRAELVAQHGSFDETLERMVDWDLILRYTREKGATYCPVLGCIYFEDSSDKGRITTTKPYIFRKIVHEKNARNLSTTSETFHALSLKFCIKIPAPYKVRHAWGDFHYAVSLQDALERLGHEVRIDFLEDWETHAVNSTDVVIVLRGLSSYKPKPNELSILWNISHPDQISYEEYSLFKLIFIASNSYAALLSKILERPVFPLLQCTDSRRFSYRNQQAVPSNNGVFIGNSRNEFREIVRWAIESNVALDIYGARWEQFVPANMVKCSNVANDELADIYAGGRFVLNDHWASMRDFGIISNRVFDVVGCGGRLISDRIHSIEHEFGGVVKLVDNPRELTNVLNEPVSSISIEQRQAVSKIVHDKHSFDARAKQIVAQIGGTVLRKTTDRADQYSHRSSPDRKTIGLLLQRGRNWPTSSAFIRLIAPLTTDYAHTKLDLIYLDDPEDPRLDDCDACIVQRIAVNDDQAAKTLIKRLAAVDTPLFIDTDDAFFFHEKHKADDVVLQDLMLAAKEVWFSTAQLKEFYETIPGTKRVIPNNLDPRFWRNYRKPVNTTFDGSVVRFLYMGTVTHDADFLEILPTFEKLADEMPGKFELTLIGAVRNPPDCSWLKILSPPPDKGAYPQFIRWLVESAKFDVGVAPLSKSQFNDAKSDIKVLDYAALGLLALVTDCTAYSEVISNGLAIGSKSTDEWYSNISDIIANPTKYVQRRNDALTRVWSERNTLTACNDIVDIIANNLATQGQEL